MVVVTRKIGESIVIDNDIYITLLGINGNEARLSINAPKPKFWSRFGGRKTKIGNKWTK